MKSLLFVIPTMRMGGAERSLVSLLSALDPTRVQVDLLLFEGGGVLQSELPDWVRVYEADAVTRGMILELRYYGKDLLKEDLPAFLSRVWMTARSALTKTKIVSPAFSWDPVKKHIPGWEKHYDTAIGFLEGFTDFYVIDKVKADKKIGWVHTDLSKRGLSKKEAAYYGQFDELVTITEKCRESMEACCPDLKGRIKVLHNLVPRERILEKAGAFVPFEKKPGVYEIATVGRLEYAKGIDLAVEAARLLKERNKLFCWRVYGDGSMRKQLEEQIKNAGLDSTVLLYGTVANPYPYLKAADLIVQPSRWEGRSVALEEAKTLCKAIVVTNYPSVSDQIADRKNGMITELSPSGLADGIEEAMENDGLRAALENGCRFAADQNAESLNGFYQLL